MLVILIIYLFKKNIDANVVMLLLSSFCLQMRRGEQREDTLFSGLSLASVSECTDVCTHVYSPKTVLFMFNVNERENCIFVLKNFPLKCFLHVTAYFLFYKISELLSERRLTRCPLQSLPWCSGFGVGWRCSSVPALSAGRVCGNPPWRQSVKFHNRKIDPT